MKPKQDVTTDDQSKSLNNQSSQSKGNDDKMNQSEPVKQEEGDLPDLKDPEVQKATSLIQVLRK